jgi:hypothetical protein
MLVAGIGTSLLLFWRLQSPSSLLPATATRQVSGFTPYFYKRSIPAGYQFDASQIQYSAGVLIVPLTKAGSPRLVITEQPLPKDLSEKNLAQDNSTRVKNAAASAYIHSVEGRWVGVMPVSGTKTLILLNSTSAEMDKDDLSALLQGLQAVR